MIKTKRFLCGEHFSHQQKPAADYLGSWAEFLERLRYIPGQKLSFSVL